MTVWDRSHDWVVRKLFTELIRVTIRFSKAPPVRHEIVAIRKLLPNLRDKPPREVATLVASGTIEIGVLPGREARLLVEEARRHGLVADCTNASRTDYIPLDRTTGMVLLIEDVKESQRTIEEMLRSGVPLEEEEA